jgi:UDP-glucose-4-epimerase GalE
VSDATTITVLVTGGAGYVGAHACKALRTAGYLPITLDNLVTGHSGFVRWGPLLRGDIRDREIVNRAIESHHVQAVLHFAASAYVGESMKEPQKYYENNVAGSLALIGAMFDAGCRKIIFSSSCAVYGEPQELPIRESAQQNPVNPYGASKMMVERILYDYHQAGLLDFVSLRYFNACGADPDGEIGELREPETHLIARAMMAIQNHVDDFAIFGTDYPTADGTAIRDYVHVCDLADAHVASLELVMQGASGSFNIGTGQGYSVKKILDAIQLETGITLDVRRSARRSGDPAVLIADPSLAKKELGFSPRCSDLSTIVKTAWNWHQRAHPKRAVNSEGCQRTQI